VGSVSCRALLHCHLTQVVELCVSVTKQYDLVLAFKDGDAYGWEGNHKPGTKYWQPVMLGLSLVLGGCGLGLGLRPQNVGLRLGLGLEGCGFGFGLGLGLGGCGLGHGIEALALTTSYCILSLT